MENDDKQNEFASSNEEDTRAISTILSQEAIDMPEGVGKLIPTDAAKALRTEYDKRGRGFALPKEVLDKLFGFKPDKGVNRAYLYSRKLNRQHPPEDKSKVWRIGVNGIEYYTVDIVDKTTIKKRATKKKKN